MTTVELRHQIDEYIDSISPERLRVAVDFLAYPTERESQEATDELLMIPRFMNSLISESSIKNYEWDKTTQLSIANYELLEYYDS